MVHDPACKRLGGLPKQLRADTAQHQKPSPVGRPVYEDTKQSEEPLAVFRRMYAPAPPFPLLSLLTATE